jgi:protein-L-isoaspartate O-methyltransferase
VTVDRDQTLRDAERMIRRGEYENIALAVGDNWRFIGNVSEARENGYDVVCVECGIGLAQDGCDMHERGCSHEQDDA